MSDDWGGRKFGELTPEEKQAAVKKAGRQLEAELNAAAPAISAIMEAAGEAQEVVLRPDTRFGGSCPACGKWLAYTPLAGSGRAYAPRLPFMTVTCDCGGKVTLHAEAQS